MNVLDSDEPSNVATFECFCNIRMFVLWCILVVSEVLGIYISSEFIIVSFTKLLYACLMTFMLKIVMFWAYCSACIITNSDKNEQIFVVRNMLNKNT